EINEASSGFNNNFEKYYHNEHDVVIDSSSALMWVDDVFWKEIPFLEAVEEVNSFNQSKYAGYSDWRLPTLKEALTLMEPKSDYDESYIDDILRFFTNRTIWTSDFNEVIIFEEVRTDYNPRTGEVLSNKKHKIKKLDMWVANFKYGSYSSVFADSTSSCYLGIVRSF
ncbi:MAG: DUF1566 domain-containing protein, partial [Candidatus Babeliaceae bacterium]|nr:DUF1566 domain-containing protein [Candidatus Babeliaceae bacterium]